MGIYYGQPRALVERTVGGSSGTGSEWTWIDQSGRTAVQKLSGHAGTSFANVHSAVVVGRQRI